MAAPVFDVPTWGYTKSFLAYDRRFVIADPPADAPCPIYDVNNKRFVDVVSVEDMHRTPPRDNVPFTTLDAGHRNVTGWLDNSLGPVRIVRGVLTEGLRITCMDVLLEDCVVDRNMFNDCAVKNCRKLTTKTHVEELDAQNRVSREKRAEKKLEKRKALESAGDDEARGHAKKKHAPKRLGTARIDESAPPSAAPNRAAPNRADVIRDIFGSPDEEVQANLSYSVFDLFESSDEDDSDAEDSHVEASDEVLDDEAEVERDENEERPGRDMHFGPVVSHSHPGPAPARRSTSASGPEPELLPPPPPARRSVPFAGTSRFSPVDLELELDDDDVPAERKYVSYRLYSENGLLCKIPDRNTTVVVTRAAEGRCVAVLLDAEHWVADIDPETNEALPFYHFQEGTRVYSVSSNPEVQGGAPGANTVTLGGEPLGVENRNLFCMRLNDELDMFLGLTEWGITGANLNRSDGAIRLLLRTKSTPRREPAAPRAAPPAAPPAAPRVAPRVAPPAAPPAAPRAAPRVAPRAAPPAAPRAAPPAAPPAAPSVAPPAAHGSIVPPGLECTICMDRMVNRVSSCGHVFCSECVLKLVNGNDDQCPTCRQYVTSFGPLYL